MSNRKAIQGMFNLPNGLFLGVLKRNKITKDLIKRGLAESREEIEEWKEEIIIELYNETIDETVNYDIEVDLKVDASLEEQLGIVEHLMAQGIDNKALKNHRVKLIRELYAGLDYVKEFNNLIVDLENEGDEQ